jgi:hypothetical protein
VPFDKCAHHPLEPIAAFMRRDRRSLENHACEIATIVSFARVSRAKKRRDVFLSRVVTGLLDPLHAPKAEIAELARSKGIAEPLVKDKVNRSGQIVIALLLPAELTPLPPLTRYERKQR